MSVESKEPKIGETDRPDLGEGKYKLEDFIIDVRDEVRNLDLDDGVVFWSKMHERDPEVLGRVLEVIREIDRETT